MAAIQHQQIDPNTGIMAALPSGVLSSETEVHAAGNNAIQTLTVARHYPKDPQQALMHKGIVDYTSGVETSDVTLDCILTEDSHDAASPQTSVYTHATRGLVIGQESYVLTSCNITFASGAPATVSYGWLTSGAASAITTQADPNPLQDGEESVFAVVMGDDGSGIGLLDYTGGAWQTTIITPIASGVQNVSFAATINKDNVLDIRSAEPIEFVTTYPVDITVDIETLNNDGSGLTFLGIGGANGTNHTDRTGYAAPSRSPFTDYGQSQKFLALSNGLVLTEQGDSINVGGFLTFTRSFTAADLAIPLWTY